MSDPFLEEIVEGAEAGRSVPPLKVITQAGDWLRGEPCSGQRFRELSYAHLLNALGPNGEDEGNQAFANFGAEDDDALVLSLESVYLGFGGKHEGHGLRLPAVRVPLDAVASWWIAGERRFGPQDEGWFGAMLDDE